MAAAQLRPLVRDMLDNLAATERIAEGVALEDWDQIEDAARVLRARATSMQLLDLESLHMDRTLDPVWDGFLIAQEQAAREISLAVRSADSQAVLQATRNLVGNSCVGCHATFRDPQNRLRGSVLFMTSFLSSWRDMNRGMMIRDYALVSTRARELAALTEVVGTNENIETAFGLGGSRQQRQFRELLSVISTNATAVSEAATAGDVRKMLDSTTAMWSEGCVACHAKFRR